MVAVPAHSVAAGPPGALIAALASAVRRGPGNVEASGESFVLEPGAEGVLSFSWRVALLLLPWQVLVLAFLGAQIALEAVRASRGFSLSLPYVRRTYLQQTTDGERGLA